MTHEFETKGIEHWARRTTLGRLGSKFPPEAVEWWIKMMARTPASSQIGFTQKILTSNAGLYSVRKRQLSHLHKARPMINSLSLADIGRPRASVRLIEREAKSEHPGLLLATVDQRAALRAIKRQIREYRKPIRVPAHRLDRHLISRVPRRRMNDGRVVTRCRHLVQKRFLIEDRYLPVRRICRQPTAPDVYLCVNNQHGTRLLF